jgi:riboflavin transporter
MSQDAPDLFSGAFFVHRGYAQCLPVNARKREEKNMPDQKETKSTGLSRNKNRVRWIAKTGILSAIAIVLMILEFNLPLMPGFLKFDFSEIPVLIAAFSMGPLTAVLVELIKNIVHLPLSQTMYVGELANFIIGSLFAVTAGLVYHWMKNRRGAYWGMAAGIVVMTAAASLINYFFLIPFYINVMEFPLDVIVNISQAAGNKLVTDLRTLIVFVFVPFNLFKGIFVSLIVALIYKRISPILHR